MGDSAQPLTTTAFVELIERTQLAYDALEVASERGDSPEAIHALYLDYLALVARKRAATLLAAASPPTYEMSR